MGAVAQVQVDQVLVGHTGFLGQSLEILDQVRSQADRDLLAKVRGIRIAGE